MGNPDTFGFLQFATKNEGTAASKCGNLEWPVRYLLAQIYQAQIQYIIAVGQYATTLAELTKNTSSKTYCTLENGCFLKDLLLIEEHASELVLRIDVQNDATSCVKYDASPRSFNGGKCFVAALSYIAPGNVRIAGSIREDRYMKIEPHDQTHCLTIHDE